MRRRSISADILIAVGILVAACGGGKAAPKRAEAPAGRAPDAAVELSADDKVDRAVVVFEEIADVLTAEGQDCAAMVDFLVEVGARHEALFAEAQEEMAAKDQRARLEEIFGHRLEAAAARMMPALLACPDAVAALEAVLDGRPVVRGAATRSQPPSPSGAKKPEAVTNVRRLFDAAKGYHIANGTFLTSPPVTTPPLGTCCASPGRKCPGDPALWAGAPWQQLGFAMSGPHFYSYTYEGTAMEFTAAAHGDLDCDGVFSTFEMVGRIAADGTVIGDKGMFRDQELE